MLYNIQTSKRHGHGWSKGVTKMGNESRPSNNGKSMGLITEATERVSNSRDSSRTIAASERALNGAILAAEISESYEEYLEIFDRFYTDDIHAPADGLKDLVVEKAAVSARLAPFPPPGSFSPSAV